MLEEGLWESPLPPSICLPPQGPRRPCSQAPAPPGPKPRLPLVQLWTIMLAAGADTYLSPTQMRERSFTSICACTASWVTFTDCTACKTQLSLRCPQLPAQEPSCTQGPTYPVEQLLRGQNFAIFIQPGDVGNQSCLVCRLGLLPLPQQGCQDGHPARVGDWGLVTCMSYTAPGENTLSRSLSLLPGLLPEGRGIVSGTTG